MENLSNYDINLGLIIIPIILIVMSILILGIIIKLKIKYIPIIMSILLIISSIFFIIQIAKIDKFYVADCYIVDKFIEKDDKNIGWCCIAVEDAHGCTKTIIIGEKDSNIVDEIEIRKNYYIVLDNKDNFITAYSKDKYKYISTSPLKDFAFD